MRLRCNSKNKGMTLIEVVAALAILAGLFGSVVVTHARLSRGWKSAQHKLVAIERLDKQLLIWWSAGQIPRDQEGFFGSLNNQEQNISLRWRTRSRVESATQPYGLTHLQVEALDPRQNPPVILATVELLLPPEQPAAGSELTTTNEARDQ